MKTLLAIALLTVIPFGGVRIICINPGTAQPATSVQPADSECRYCIRATPKPVNVTCALESDPSCAFVLGSTVAVIPAGATLSFVGTVQSVGVTTRAAYRVPTLDRAGPPPKA
jgi:hypothetical protein